MKILKSLWSPAVMGVVGLCLATVAWGQSSSSSGDGVSGAEQALTASGRLSFGIGDEDLLRAPNAPLFNTVREASAGLELTSSDERVAASLQLDLLPQAPAESATSPLVGTDEYGRWLRLRAYGAYWNRLRRETYAAGDSTEEVLAGFPAADGSALVAEINSAGVELAELNAGGEIAFYEPVTGELGAGETQFAWTEENAARIAGAELRLRKELEELTETALERIVNAGSADLRAALEAGADPPGFSVDAAADGFGIATAYAGASTDDIGALSAEDAELLSQALAIEREWLGLAGVGLAAAGASAGADRTGDGASGAAGAVREASVSFTRVAGVMDVGLLFGGGRVTAGPFTLDGFGHEARLSAPARRGYHGLTLGLSRGVYRGLSGELGVYIDGRDAREPVDEAFATWESDAAPAAAPAYGARLATGYEHDFQRITIGGELEAGVYDAFGTPRWGVSLVPSIAGLGGALEAEFAYGLDVLYGRVTGSYGVLGIVPEATLYYSEPGEYTLAYTPVPESVLSLAKRDGGVAGELGLSADLGMFVPVPITMEGGVDLYFENGLERAWDYTLAVTPILGLTAVGSLSGDSVAGNWSSNINWSAGLEYAYGIATITGRIFQEWSALQQERRIGWSIETAVAF